ncbi:GGDEF domain-containing protein [Marinimicrobium sp. ABcell2]|uniref:GGDEF domain-containing protein n=1 Tax=Marinimicrobium sp. ABcell2 TaxID=3069751 RepID=UPI0027B5AE37|nr:GGDEF domain-containing protein [Marinimicrobium sp. ABcell2]MDQ2075840.1 GGDEF domain-containing protein [Marinimicrobium sp. ABcell2]
MRVSPILRAKRFAPEQFLLLLVVLTIGVLLFHGPLLETRLVITPGDDTFRFELDSDVQDGGDTVVEWIEKDELRWRCQLGQAWPHPFCGMQVYFSDSYLDGIDLTRYTHMNFHLDYAGSAQSVRIFLRNSNPEYTRPDEIRSTKFNAVELDTRKGPFYEDIRLSYFRVADWWIQLYDLSVRQTQLEFSNVGLIEIQTGTGLTGGSHQFQLHELELVGVRIKTETLYLGIIVAWIFAILIYLTSRIRLLSLAVKSGNEKQAELREINQLLEQRRRILERRSKLDPLTGAYNRAGIEESLAESFKNWRYKNKPLSLLLFDVDHFKAVNDTHGHTVGDRVLRELTSVILSNIRGTDRFARWGGEEFIIVCGDTELTQATDMAEKLRRIISESTFADGLDITVSFGVAQIQPGETLEALFNRTDQALYKAKDAGRNTVCTGDNT